jgi:hypothetical protein
MTSKYTIPDSSFAIKPILVFGSLTLGMFIITRIELAALYNPLHCLKLHCTTNFTALPASLIAGIFEKQDSGSYIAS